MVKLGEVARVVLGESRELDKDKTILLYDTSFLIALMQNQWWAPPSIDEVLEPGEDFISVIPKSVEREVELNFERKSTDDFGRPKVALPYERFVKFYFKDGQPDSGMLFPTLEEAYMLWHRSSRKAGRPHPLNGLTTDLNLLQNVLHYAQNGHKVVVFTDDSDLIDSIEKIKKGSKESRVDYVSSKNLQQTWFKGQGERVLITDQALATIYKADMKSHTNYFLVFLSSQEIKPGFCHDIGFAVWDQSKYHREFPREEAGVKYEFLMGFTDDINEFNDSLDRFAKIRQRCPDMVYILGDNPSLGLGIVHFNIKVMSTLKFRPSYASIGLLSKRIPWCRLDMGYLQRNNHELFGKIQQYSERIGK